MSPSILEKQTATLNKYHFKKETEYSTDLSIKKNDDTNCDDRYLLPFFHFFLILIQTTRWTLNRPSTELKRKWGI